MQPQWPICCVTTGTPEVPVYTGPSGLQSLQLSALTRRLCPSQWPTSPEWAPGSAPLFWHSTQAPAHFLGSANPLPPFCLSNALSTYSSHLAPSILDVGLLEDCLTLGSSQVLRTHNTNDTQISNSRITSLQELESLCFALFPLAHLLCNVTASAPTYSIM